jgi:hypothetical protein
MKRAIGANDWSGKPHRARYTVRREGTSTAIALAFRKPITREINHKWKCYSIVETDQLWRFRAHD